MRIITLALALACTFLPLKAQTGESDQLSPKVQEVQWQSAQVKFPGSFFLVLDGQRQNTYPIRNLQTWTHTTTKRGEGLRLTLGVRGDKSIRSVEKHIPHKTEGYYLLSNEKGITIAGHDERGLFYGLQTLRQLVAGSLVGYGAITDYPDVPYRGVVEGFYGTPWSFEDRLSQLKFYGRNKLNVYIYGPKDDPYHSVPSWRKPYPEAEAEHIRQLVTAAHDNGVIFYWAIHPGQDIKWNDADRDLLIQKFESMYQLGVRGFAVFFDDISGEGTKADKQAELLNYIDTHFIKAKGDVAPLIMCPTEYNKAWSNIPRGYLPTLGDKLHQGIEVMWTGNTVVSCLDKPDVAWINSHIKRKAYIWFNFPVTDFVRDHLLMGKTYGNSLEIASDLSGFLSNPMEHAEASKVALFSVADYTWNMKAYNANASWERAMYEVFPQDPDALMQFARHSSALGPNGHRFERKESEDLQPILEKVILGSASEQELKLLLAECGRIHSAANRLLGATEEPALIEEMRPWLQMAKLVAQYGMLVCMPKDQIAPADVYRYYREARGLQRQMYLLDTEVNQNPYQPGVKYGSQWLLPALNACFKRDVEAFNKKYQMSLEAPTAYLPFSLETNIGHLKAQPLITRGKQVMISPSNEVIKWQEGDYLLLRAKHGERLGDFSADMGVAGAEKLFRLEALVGGVWQTIALKAGRSTTLHAETDLKSLQIDALRWTYRGATPQDCRLRVFRFVLK